MAIWQTKQIRSELTFRIIPPMDETGMVDLWQIEDSLSLTPAQRIKRFEEFLKFSYALRKAGMKTPAAPHARFD